MTVSELIAIKTSLISLLPFVESEELKRKYMEKIAQVSTMIDKAYGVKIEETPED